MRCPVCGLDQLIVEYEGVELDLCIQGCGTWFDADELRQLFAAAGAPERLADLARRLEELPRGGSAPERRCPRCDRKMQHVRAPAAEGGVILDRCRRGHGLWFDPGELEAILAASLGDDDAALLRVRGFLDRFHPAAAAPAFPSNQEA